MRLSIGKQAFDNAQTSYLLFLKKPPLTNQRRVQPTMAVQNTPKPIHHFWRLMHFLHLQYFLHLVVQ